jgi:hypothetical protein
MRPRSDRLESMKELRALTPEEFERAAQELEAVRGIARRRK